MSANFSTGPVAVSPAVTRAFHAPPMSHRSDAFAQLARETCARLCAFTGAQHVAIASGSGTLANDIIAQQLRFAKGRGVIIADGEFGERLCTQAASAGLRFDVLRAPWGDCVDVATIESHLQKNQGVAWLWCTQHETSTGVAHDVQALCALAKRYAFKLCLDCMSAIGMTALDLRDVYLASASSGKGLASYAGLALVFAQTRNVPSAPNEHIAPSLDLGRYLLGDGIPFTLSSNLLAALHASVASIDEFRYERIARDSAEMREQFERAGFSIIAKAHCAASGIIAMSIPKEISTQQLGESLRRDGVHIGFESAYLRERHWVQIALMGEYDTKALRCLPERMRTLIHSLKQETSYAS